MLGSRMCASPPTLRFAIVERDRDARAEADRRDDVAAAPHGVVGDLHANVREVAAHSGRKMRSRPSTAAKRVRAAPSSVSTLPSTRNPVGRERVVELLEQTLLRLAIEVDQHVAAADEMVRSRRRAPRRAGRGARSAPAACTSGTIVNGACGAKYRSLRSRRRLARSRPPRTRRAPPPRGDRASMSLPSTRTRARPARRRAAAARRAGGTARRASTAPRPTSIPRSTR